jgi:hypothetical protein
VLERRVCVEAVFSMKQTANINSPRRRRRRRRPRIGKSQALQRHVAPSRRRLAKHAHARRDARTGMQHIASSIEAKPSNIDSSRRRRRRRLRACPCSQELAPAKTHRARQTTTRRVHAAMRAQRSLHYRQHQSSPRFADRDICYQSRVSLTHPKLVTWPVARTKTCITTRLSLATNFRTALLKAC